MCIVTAGPRQCPQPPSRPHHDQGPSLGVGVLRVQRAVEGLRRMRREPVRTAALIRQELVAIRRSCNLLELEFSARTIELTTAPDWQPAESPVDVVRDDCKMSRRTAASAVRVGEQAAKLPDSIRAVEAGEIGFDHLSLMAGTAHALSASPTAISRFDERPLLDRARSRSVADFRHDCSHARHAADAEGFLAAHRDTIEARSLKLRPDDGLMYLQGTLDSVGGASVRAALEPLARPRGAGDHRERDRRLADALIELADHGLDEGATTSEWLPAGDLPNGSGDARETEPKLDRVAERGEGGQLATGDDLSRQADISRRTGPSQRTVQRPHLQVTTTLETLMGLAGAPAGEMELSDPVSAATVQRLACDSTITRVLLNPESVVMDLGRSQRVVSGATRKALHVRDRGCRWPGCDRPPSWTQAHHLTHWVHGGETNLDNLILLCWRHHSMLHEFGWKLVRNGANELVPVPPRPESRWARGGMARPDRAAPRGFD